MIDAMCDWIDCDPLRAAVVALAVAVLVIGAVGLFVTYL